MKDLIIENGILTSYFGDSYSVTELIIPASVKSFSQKFEEELYTKMVNLKTISVDKGSTSFASKNGILYDKSLKQVIFYPRAKNRKEYIMPDTVVSIHENAFSNGVLWPAKLQDIILSKNLKEIPDNCFKNMNVFSVTMQEGLLEIGKYAFAGSDIVCPTLPSTLRHLEETAFNDCHRLHILNIREDNFELKKEMLPQKENNDMYVIIETKEQIDKSKYPGINVMNLLEMDHWIES